MFAARAMSKAAAPARAVASRAAVAAPKRGMAGGAAPKYTGLEAKVREKLPKDEHVSFLGCCDHLGFARRGEGEHEVGATLLCTWNSPMCCPSRAPAMVSAMPESVSFQTTSCKCFFTFRTALDRLLFRGVAMQVAVLLQPSPRVRRA